MKKRLSAVPCFLILLSIVSSSALVQPESPITIENVSGNVYCLYSSAANIGVLKCDTYLVLVDSEYARTADRIKEEITKFSPLEIKFLINTHYHNDHTGGNPILGRSADIISHKNCRSSFLASLKPEEIPGIKSTPWITFKKEMCLQLEKEAVWMFHLKPAHTAGDTIVVFTESKVILAGDLFFHGMPPYIDVQDGSDTENWILIIRKMAEKFPDFKEIPGHGQVTDMSNWLKFADYLDYLRAEVSTAIKAGKTREQAMDSIDLSQYSSIQDSGEFLTKKNNIGWIYDEMTRKSQEK